MALCLGLLRFRNGVQHVARFVEPAALLFRRAKDLAQRVPGPQSTIPMARSGAWVSPRRCKSRRNSRPVDRQGFARKPREGALGAFTIAVGQIDNFLSTPLIRADEH